MKATIRGHMYTVVTTNEYMVWTLEGCPAPCEFILDAFEDATKVMSDLYNRRLATLISESYVSVMASPVLPGDVTVATACLAGRTIISVRSDDGGAFVSWITEQPYSGGRPSKQLSIHGMSCSVLDLRRMMSVVVNWFNEGPELNEAPDGALV